MAAGIDIADLVRPGVAVVVATRDAELRPELSRAWGPALSDDGERLTVCVEARSELRDGAQPRSGSPVAVHLARLAPRTTVQLKGAVLEAGRRRRTGSTRSPRTSSASWPRPRASGSRRRSRVRWSGRDLLTVTIEVGRAVRRDARGRAREPLSEAVALESIRDCLRGGLPSPMATCSPDGTPHISYVSRGALPRP